ncbi:MAG: hypothetical protein WDM89_15755 [Rhizomicrobium sp.]
MSKPSLSQEELETMITEELRKFPECDSVIEVGVTRPTEDSWDAALLIENDGPVPEKATQIVRALIAQFDLA